MAIAILNHYLGIYRGCDKIVFLLIRLNYDLKSALRFDVSIHRSIRNSERLNNGECAIS